MPRPLGNGAVPFFPEPLPGEHLFSILARFHRLSGNRSPAVTCAQLGIAEGTLKAQDVFNAPFRTAVPAVAVLLGTESAEIARWHTLVPLFRGSVPVSTLRRWGECWRRGEPVPADAAQPMNWRMLRHDRSWRYCRRCVADDTRRYGVAYWHVVHQIPGLGTCPHHGAPLSGACRSCGRARSTLNDLALPGPVCDCPTPAGAKGDAAWDTWLHGRFTALREADDGALERTLRELRTGFGLPPRLTGGHRAAIGRTLERVERALGRERLAAVFEFYATADGTYRDRSRPNILWTTLTASGQRPRHPLYFLVLLYALKLGAAAANAA